MRMTRVASRQTDAAKSLRWLCAALLTCSVWSAIPQSFAAEPGTAALLLRAKHKALAEQLSNNQYQRAIHLVSAESTHDLKGEIFAVVDYPMATVDQALNNPMNWCDVLILHVNIKYCHASSNKVDAVLTVDLGKKVPQPLADAYRLAFNYRSLMATPDYFSVELKAEIGPLGTHDYRIWIETTPLDEGHTILHFTYAYGFGLAGRIALQSYLATGGRSKVGFTVTGRLPNGQPAYIKGVRGVVERNTMRYYLAIDAYLAALATPPADRLEQRLQSWYNGTEQYARQLHEIRRLDYLEMKRKEYQRQQVAQ